MAETPALGQPCPSSWHPQRRPRSGLDLAQGSHLRWTRNPAPRLRSRSPGIRPLPCPLTPDPPPGPRPARPSSVPPLEAWKTPRPVLPFLAGGRVPSRLLSCQAAHPHSAPTPNQTREPQLPPQSPPSPLRSPAPSLGLQDFGVGDRTHSPPYLCPGRAVGLITPFTSRGEALSGPFSSLSVPNPQLLGFPNKFFPFLS